MTETNNHIMPKNNMRIINAWCSYDVANSVYNLIITAVLFPIYYQQVTKAAFADGIIPLWGMQIKNSVLYDFTFAFAYFVIIILTPLLSGFADYMGLRRLYMRIFTTVGSIACFSLFWFDGTNIMFGCSMVALAAIGYAGSLVYYNSFLPIIATRDRHDRISARGFSWGYGGSVILLIMCLLFINNYDSFGLSGKLEAIRYSFCAVGIWWLGVSQIALFMLKDYPSQRISGTKLMGKGVHELKKVFNFVSKRKNMNLFLISFFFLSMGVQTVMLVATLFGSIELGISGPRLIIVILLIQLLGIVGSILFGIVSQRRGNKISLIIMLITWFGICMGAYLVQTEAQFFALAGVVGLVMGGIQSQARSTWAKLIPEDSVDTASFFSFFDVTEKAAIVIGMFSFGFIEHLTGNMRNSTLVLSIYFLLSLSVLMLAQLPKGTKSK